MKHLSTANRLKNTGCFFLLLLIIAVFSCEKEEKQPYLDVEFDRILFVGEDSTTIFTLTSNRNWAVEITEGNDWITLYNASGKASGAKQSVGIRVLTNNNANREGILTVRAGELTKQITVAQGPSVIRFGTPELSDNLFIYASLANTNTTLNIPYSKAVGNETFNVSVSVTGPAAGGIDNIVDHQVTLTASSGVIPIPLSGASSVLGEVTFHITTNYSEGSIEIEPITTTVNTIMIGKPSLSKDITVLTPLGGTYLLIPYGKADATSEAFNVSVEITGTGSAGIDNVSNFTYMLNQKSDTIRIPLSGTAEKTGLLRFTVTTDYPGVEIDLLNARVNMLVYFSMDFNKMELGGDIIGHANGKLVDATQTPWIIDNNELTFPENPVFKQVNFVTLATMFMGSGTAREDGTSGVISQSYREMRGFIGNWEATNVFEQPGYVTFGFSRGNGDLTTPELTNIPNTRDVKVTFKYAKSEYAVASGNKVTVSVIGSGIMTSDDETAVFSTLRPNAFDFTTYELRVWETKRFTILGADSSTRLRFETTNYVDGERSFSLDEILVFSD